MCGMLFKQNERSIMSNLDRYSKFKSIFGPGLMFAATSVGVSHIVQSTRAGADFGLGLMLMIIVVNLIKYPAFQFGTRYALATGTTLLQGYRNIGNWAVYSYGLINLLFMPILFAALIMGMSGVIIVITGIEMSTTLLGPIIMVICIALLKLGRYSLLEKITKILVVIFTVLTFTAAFVTLFTYDVFSSFVIFPSALSFSSIFFIVALIGWMPTGLEVSVWQSVWTLKKTTKQPDEEEAKQFRLDFNIGFMGTTLLAISFMILGTALMHNIGEQFPASAPAFIARVIELYRVSIGEWSVPLIGICTFAVFFSTTIAVFDGYPRILIATADRLKSDEEPWAVKQYARSTLYTVLIVSGAIGAYMFIALWGNSFATFIDFSTTISFLYGPIVAFLNHIAMNSKDVPLEYKPGKGMNFLSIAGITILTLVGVYYCYLKFSM